MFDLFQVLLFLEHFIAGQFKCSWIDLDIYLITVDPKGFCLDSKNAVYIYLKTYCALNLASWERWDVKIVLAKLEVLRC